MAWSVWNTDAILVLSTMVVYVSYRPKDARPTILTSDLPGSSFIRGSFS